MSILCRLRPVRVPGLLQCSRHRGQPWRALTFSSDDGGPEDGRGPGKEVSMATSSLRIDTVASTGLDISRKKIWEAHLDGLVMLNGEKVKKKSASVEEGDVIEVDTILEGRPQEPNDQGEMVRRGRVVVKEIGPRTRKGGYHLTLMRYKQFEVFKRNLSSITVTTLRSYSV